MVSAPRKLLTEVEVAELLSLKRRTVGRLRRSGDLPAVLLSPKLIRYRVEDVEAFAASRSTGVAAKE